MRRDAAEAPEGPLLKHAQKLRLRRRRERRDLVEVSRTVCGDVEQPALRRDRAGERAALVPEELALEEVVGEIRRVDADERPVRRASDASWIARASRSFPVPLSPTMRTVRRQIDRALERLDLARASSRFRVRKREPRDPVFAMGCCAAAASARPVASRPSVRRAKRPVSFSASPQRRSSA